MVVAFLLVCASTGALAKGNTPHFKPTNPTVSVRAEDGSGNGACWIKPDGPPLTHGASDLTLFVAGLNHGGHCFGPGSHEGVEQKGLDQLVDFIVAMTNDPAGLVIALSGNMICTCAGVDVPASKRHHTDCLAAMLSARFGITFTAKSVDLWDIGGNAVITGPRWVPDEPQLVHVDPSSRFMRITLRDKRQPLNAPGSKFQLAVVHLSDNAGAQPEVDATMRHLESLQKGNPVFMPPMIVGDFNAPNCGRPECAAPAWRTAGAGYLEGYLRNEFDWADREIVCEDRSAKLRLENDIIHVLLGKTTRRFDFRCAPRRFRRAQAAYVTDGGGNPLFPREGVFFGTYIRHNVVALSFEILPQSTPASCKVSETPEDGAVCRNPRIDAQTWCTSKTKCCAAAEPHCCPKNRRCTPTGCK